MIKLHNCPHCGGVPGASGVWHQLAVLDHQTWYYVRCDACGATGQRKQTAESAIAAWNTRSITAALALPKIAALVDAARYAQRELTFALSQSGLVLENTIGVILANLNAALATLEGAKETKERTRRGRANE